MDYSPVNRSGSPQGFVLNNNELTKKTNREGRLEGSSEEEDRQF